MDPVELQKLDRAALESVHKLGQHYGCRIEVSSEEGFRGRFNCTASNADRSQQGFGPTVAEAVRNLIAQPVRGSSNMPAKGR